MSKSSNIFSNLNNDDDGDEDTLLRNKTYLFESPSKKKPNSFNDSHSKSGKHTENLGDKNKKLLIYIIVLGFLFEREILQDLKRGDLLVSPATLA